MEKLNVYKEIEFDGPVINNETGKVFHLNLFFKLPFNYFSILNYFLIQACMREDFGRSNDRDI